MEALKQGFRADGSDTLEKGMGGMDPRRLRMDEIEEIGGPTHESFQDELPSLLKLVNKLVERLENKQRLINYLSRDLMSKDKAIKEKEELLERDRRERDSQASKAVEKKLIHDLLSVMDSFERAFKVAEQIRDEEIKIWVGGVSLIYKQLKAILSDYEVTTIKSVGEVFNPNTHEVVDYQATDDYDDDVILEEKLKGYLMVGEVIRKAKVVVARRK
jgi:molecular chaperone GrpE